LPPQAQKELLGWIDTGNEGAVDKFFADAMAKSLLLDWMMKLAMHNSGQRTPYASLKHYQKYETGSISSLLAQDVLLMAGAEDHNIPVHQLPDQHPHACALTDRAPVHARGTGAEPLSNRQYGPGVSGHNRLDGKPRDDREAPPVTERMPQNVATPHRLEECLRGNGTAFCGHSGAGTWRKRCGVR
jgi:hypothetical protein